MEIDISVVVPFYNAERYISTCIKALLSQSYPTDRYEIIMIDNNSTDRSVEIVKRFPFIKLQFGLKQGAYAARNHGINQSKGDIIAFTDPDCIPSPTWLQKISEAMESPEIKAVIGCREPAYDSPLLSKLGAYEKVKDEYVFNSEISELYYGYNNNMAVRREIFDELGLFIERSRGSDTIFIRKVVEMYSCHSVVYCPDIRVKHMEIDNVLKYYRKMFIYGRSRQKYRNIAYTRSLNNCERIKVFLRTIHSQDYKSTKCIILFSLLAIGSFCWNLGNLSSIFSSKREISHHHTP
ncbi:MAG: glycosyltransferase [Candidatus Hodarchaeota archaeon]